MSTTTSNGVTGSLVKGHVKVSAREPNMNRTTTILSPDHPPSVPPSPRSLSQTAPAVTT
ncbi:MAG: hypothetical protein ACRDNS_29170 [Trebonia sp.]